MSSAPQAMTRHPLPSIVLSVSIVCFFAIALFQPDPPTPLRGVRRTPAGSERARFRSVAPAAGASTAAATSGMSQGPSKRSLPAIGGASNPRSADGTSASAATARPVSHRTRGPRENSDRESTAPQREHTHKGAVAPRAPFTVVKAGESLGDVSLRVYGTTGAAISLWRANRDSLERQDSPLAVGMLLRTPTIP
jgi:hypothetical protein